MLMDQGGPFARAHGIEHMNILGVPHRAASGTGAQVEKWRPRIGHGLRAPLGRLHATWFRARPRAASCASRALTVCRSSYFAHSVKREQVQRAAQPAAVLTAGPTVRPTVQTVQL